MLKQCKVVMLPTKEKAPIFKFKGNNRINSTKHIANLGHDDIYQHLYIISDDTIKDNDYIIVLKTHKDLLVNDIIKYKSTIHSIDKSYCKKIIATTNKSIRIEQTINNVFGKNYLPFLSESFIKKYIEEYNKNNQITDIRVEYEKLSLEGILYESAYYDNEEDIPNYRVKVNKDNTITIKKLKINYTKEDLILAMESAIIHGKRIQTYYMSNIGEPPLTPVSFINDYISNIN